jgi:hypothetical protein
VDCSWHFLTLHVSKQSLCSLLQTFPCSRAFSKFKTVQFNVCITSSAISKCESFPEWAPISRWQVRWLARWI